MARLQGKDALVTGGANGLGEAIATRMAEEVAAIGVVDRDEDGGPSAGGVPGLRRHPRVGGAGGRRRGRGHFGRLDVLVNNAGVEGVNKPTHEVTLDEWEHVMAVNTTAVWLCTECGVPHMKAARSRSIINISSIYGILGGADVPPRHASKGAARASSKNDALIYAPDNIRINSIHPGFIFTSMVHRYIADAGMTVDDARLLLGAAHPLSGTGEADDIAWGAVCLASDHAKWVTGSELVIDGGYTAVSGTGPANVLRSSRAPRVMVRAPHGADRPQLCGAFRDLATAGMLHKPTAKSVRRRPHRSTLVGPGRSRATSTHEPLQRDGGHGAGCSCPPCRHESNARTPACPAGVTRDGRFIAR